MLEERCSTEQTETVDDDEPEHSIVTKHDDGRHKSSRTIPETTTETTSETTSEEKDIVQNLANLQFDTFWNAYDKKINISKCRKKFISLKPDDIELILKNVHEYVKSTHDKSFRKNPLTYLNNESWNDEILDIHKKGGNNGSNPQDKRRGHMAEDTREPCIPVRLPIYI